MNTTMDKPANTMNTTITEEDTNTLRAVCEAIWADQFCAPDHINTIVGLHRKYGQEQVLAYVIQFKAEKQGATK